MCYLNKSYRLAFGVVLMVGLSACATPEIVATKQIGDKKMNCQQIEKELEQIKKIKTEADADRGVSGKNVAAAILFWPAIIGNQMNTSKAIEAANKRESYLVELYDAKNCS